MPLLSSSPSLCFVDCARCTVGLISCFHVYSGGNQLICRTPSHMLFGISDDEHAEGPEVRAGVLNTM